MVQIVSHASPRAFLRSHPECLRLYAVTSSAWLGHRRLAECVEQAVRGGATFVQLRDKSASPEALARLYAEVNCALGKGVSPWSAYVPVILNDNVQAALACDAAGVHVGQSDMGAAHARALLGPDKIIGVSARTVEQARAAQRDGADYLGVGAICPTTTKADAQPMTPEYLAEICAAVDIPVVGIGGLNEDNVDILAQTGVQGAAVVSALFAADDIEAAARRLRERLEYVL